MTRFKMVKLFFIRRISILGLLGISCYVFFALQQFTIIWFPNLWEVIITSLGAGFFAAASYYLSRYRTFGRIDDFLMGEIDHACNKLIDADDPQKLKPHGDIYTPKLLVAQVQNFGIDILKTFCRKDIFQLVEGGILSIKDHILPNHPISVYPFEIKERIDSTLYDFIDLYLRYFPEEISILKTNRTKKIVEIVDVDEVPLDIYNMELENMFERGVPLPFEKAIITPITLNKSNIGYLLLFYHSQSFISRLINPKEMIDNYMLKKIEDWKLDDAIKSIINKERLLLSFYLEKIIDDITTPTIKSYGIKKPKLNFENVCKDVLEVICKILKIDKGGFFYEKKTDQIFCQTKSLSEMKIHQIIIPYIKSNIAADNKKVSNFKIREMPSPVENIDFNNVIYVKIEYENEELGLLGLFTTREIEEFDRLVLDIIEDIKLDDLFLHMQN